MLAAGHVARPAFYLTFFRLCLNIQPAQPVWAEQAGASKHRNCQRFSDLLRKVINSKFCTLFPPKKAGKQHKNLSTCVFHPGPPSQRVHAGGPFSLLPSGPCADGELGCQQGEGLCFRKPELQLHNGFIWIRGPHMGLPLCLCNPAPARGCASFAGGKTEACGGGGCS